MTVLRHCILWGMLLIAHSQLCAVLLIGTERCNFDVGIYGDIRRCHRVRQIAGNFDCSV